MSTAEWFSIVDNYFLWQIEHGVIKPENIAVKTETKLAKALNCKITDFLAPDDEE